LELAFGPPDYLSGLVFLPVGQIHGPRDSARRVDSARLLDTACSRSSSGRRMPPRRQPKWRPEFRKRRQKIPKTFDFPASGR
jgi:hypothetical protein